MRYIDRKKEEYDEHVGPQARYTDTELMQFARNKYVQLVDDELWNKPSDDQEKIIALQAELKQLKTVVHPAWTKAQQEDKKQEGHAKGGQEGQQARVDDHTRRRTSHQVGE